uniref:Putative ribonuclease H-like domain-containing protein n=1 Tax=Tanacetum cinerariifolium TaxID=118510 RepID=A0A6L2LFP8_TANCI|nr:putative ribonuclease H-like domain-containing protein [Tanacetum cinerariifolium]
MQTQTSNTLHNVIMEAGRKDRPPMLASDKEVPTSEGSHITRTERVNETYKNISQEIRDQLNAEAEAVQIILKGIDNDIYSTVDACLNACEMWKAIKRLKQGESINVQDLETNLYWEFGKFTSQDGESLESYYSSLSSSKSSYSLHSEFLKQPPQAATRNRGKAIINSPQPIYDQEPSMVSEDDETSKDKKIDKLMALISLSFKKIYKPTNNNLRTSSNTSRENQDNSPRINRGTGYENQRMRDDSDDDELEDQELEAHYMYMAQLQEVSPDAADSGPIFDDEPLQKVSNNDHYNVFAMESVHPKQSKYVHHTYPIEQDAQNVIIDSLDMNYDREEIDQNDDDNDLAKERELLTSLIEKLKCEIDENKTRNKFLETSNKVLVEKLKSEIEDFKNKNKSLESSNNFFKEANNRLSETNNLLYADYKKSEAKLARLNSKEYASQMELKCEKVRDKALDKVIELENIVKVFDSIVYKTGQSVQTMNMLNNKCRTSFAKPEFLKKGQRANPCLYDIGCYNENLALMLAPDSDEVIRLEKESRSKLSDLIRTFDYDKLNNLYDFFPQHEKSSEQRYFSERSRLSHINVNNRKSKEAFNKQTTLFEKWMDESIQLDKKCQSSIEIFKVKSYVNTIITGVELCKQKITNRTYIGYIDPFIQNTIEQNFSPIISRINAGLDQFHREYYYADHMTAILGVYTELDEVTNLQYLDVSFKKSTCFISDLKGNDLLTAWLWHRHLSHLNFNTINLLSKNDIVVGLLKLKFVKDHLCSSCELGKAKRKSFHTKLFPSSKRRLQLLHMDLCGPMRVASINGKIYVLVIVDDYSKYTWTHFLRSKDETPKVLINFLRLVQRGFQAQVRVVRTNKGMKILNQTLHAYFAAEGILHQTSVARTPEQNGVFERRNRTLVEAARTMLSAAKVPLFFWAEAIATTCFTQSRSLVIPRHEKTPYHIINDRKPSVKFFYIFGSICYIVRDGENLDKMKEKGDECIFVGYSTQSRAYRVFNKRTRVIMESIHVNFDELPLMASDQISSDHAPECQTMALNHDSLSPTIQRQENVPQTDRTVTTSNELDLLFSLMFDELLNGSSKVVSKSSVVCSADAPNQRQQHTTPLNNHTTPAPTCQVPTLEPTVTSSKNINQAETYAEYDQVKDDEFINIFYHPLEQVIGNPSQSVRTRLQLESDAEMCMFVLTVSQTKPKNIKEAMADSAWIESMQEELHQFHRLDVWELVDRPLCTNVINLKWLWKNKRDEENTIIRNKSHLVAKGYAQRKELILKNHSHPLLGWKPGDILLMQIYVDDIIFGVTNPNLSKRFKKLMHSKFEMSMMGEMKFILGIQIYQSSRGIFINQAKYAQEILKKHGMTSCNSIGTPMATKYLNVDLSGTPVDQTKYRSKVRALMYLIESRPDIMHATCYCARYQAQPTEKHLTAAKWTFRYLKDTIHMGLWYPKDTGFELTAFLDSNHAGCLDSRKSASGGIQFLGGDKLVNWSSKKQDCTLMSSVEAEYVSLSTQANVVAKALSRKEWMKPRRARTMSMTIHSSIKARIPEAQSEASKDVNVLAEMLKG